MWASLGSKIVTALIGQLVTLIPKAINAFKGYLERKKKRKETETVAKRIENANDSSAVFDELDSLP